MSDNESEILQVSDEEDDFDISDDEDDEKPKKNKLKENKKRTLDKPKQSPTKKNKIEENSSSTSLNTTITNSNKLKKDSTTNSSLQTSTNRSNSSNNMKGPPVSTPLEARNLIRDYMLQQNRPYSALQIHDNLHQRVAKPQVQRGYLLDFIIILNSLTSLFICN